MLLRVKRFMIIGNKLLRGLDVTALCHVLEILGRFHFLWLFQNKDW